MGFTGTEGGWAAHSQDPWCFRRMRWAPKAPFCYKIAQLLFSRSLSFSRGSFLFRSLAPGCLPTEGGVASCACCSRRKYKEKKAACLHP